jgi:hypothetical protein
LTTEKSSFTPFKASLMTEKSLLTTEKSALIPFKASLMTEKNALSTVKIEWKRIKSQYSRTLSSFCWLNHLDLEFRESETGHRVKEKRRPFLKRESLAWENETQLI